MARKKPTLTSIVNQAFRIKPLIEGPGGELHWLTPLDLYRDSLMDMLQTVDVAQNLKETGKFTVDIPVLPNGAAQPKQFQILPEIPRNLRKDAVAFKINFNDEAQPGFKTATVTVYSGEMPKEVKRQRVWADGKEYKKTSPRAPRPKKPAPVFNAETFLKHDAIIAPEPASFAKKQKPQTP